MKYYLTIIVFLIVNTLNVVQSQPITSKNSINVEGSKKTSQPWSQWELTQAQWLRYQSLKTQGIANEYPEATPIQILGMNTTSSQEQMKYAEITAKREIDKLVRELTWQNAVNVAKELPRVKRYLQKRNTEYQRAALATASNISPAIATGYREELFDAEYMAIVEPTCHVDCVKINGYAKRLALEGNKVTYLVLGNQNVANRWAQVNKIKPGTTIKFGQAADFYSKLQISEKDLPIMLRRFEDGTSTFERY